MHTCHTWERAQVCIHKQTYENTRERNLPTPTNTHIMQESLTLIHQQTYSAHKRARLAYTNKHTEGESAAYTAKVERLQTKLSALLVFSCMLQWMTGRRRRRQRWCWRRCVFAAVDASSAVSVLLNWPAARAPASLLSPSHAHTLLLVLLLFSFRFSFGVLLLNEAEPLPLRSGFYCASS